MGRKAETVETLTTRIADLEATIKNKRADLAEAKRSLRQLTRLQEVDKALEFYKEFGHYEDKLRNTVQQQKQAQEKSPQ